MWRQVPSSIQTGERESSITIQNRPLPIRLIEVRYPRRAGPVRCRPATGSSKTIDGRLAESRQHHRCWRASSPRASSTEIACAARDLAWDEVAQQPLHWNTRRPARRELPPWSTSGIWAWEHLAPRKLPRRNGFEYKPLWRISSAALKSPPLGAVQSSNARPAIDAGVSMPLIPVSGRKTSSPRPRRACAAAGNSQITLLIRMVAARRPPPGPGSQAARSSKPRATSSGSAIRVSCSWFSDQAQANLPLGDLRCRAARFLLALEPRSSQES